MSGIENLKLSQGGSAPATSAPSTPSSANGTAQSSPMDHDSLIIAVRKQVEYYFSKENLQQDAFLTQQMDASNCVPISVVMRFSKMKSLVNGDETIVREALKDSLVCPVLDDGRIKAIAKTGGRSKIILRDIPADTPEESVREIFNFDGCRHIVSIRSDIENTWFVEMDSETDAKDTLLDLKLKRRTFNGENVKARLKTEVSVRSFYSQPPPKPVINNINSYLGGPQLSPYGYGPNGSPIGIGGTQLSPNGMPMAYQNHGMPLPVDANGNPIPILPNLNGGQGMGMGAMSHGDGTRGNGYDNSISNSNASNDDGSKNGGSQQGHGQGQSNNNKGGSSSGRKDVTNDRAQGGGGRNTNNGNGQNGQRQANANATDNNNNRQSGNQSSGSANINGGGRNNSSTNAGNSKNGGSPNANARSNSNNSNNNNNNDAKARQAGKSKGQGTANTGAKVSAHSQQQVEVNLQNFPPLNVDEVIPKAGYQSDYVKYTQDDIIAIVSKVKDAPMPLYALNGEPLNPQEHGHAMTATPNMDLLRRQRSFSIDETREQLQQGKPVQRDAIASGAVDYASMVYGDLRSGSVDETSLRAAVDIVAPPTSAVSSAPSSVPGSAPRSRSNSSYNQQQSKGSNNNSSNKTGGGGKGNNQNRGASAVPSASSWATLVKSAATTQTEPAKFAPASPSRATSASVSAGAGSSAALEGKPKGDSKISTNTSNNKGTSAKEPSHSNGGGNNKGNRNQRNKKDGKDNKVSYPLR
jgi:hypothetical protein